MSDSDIVTRCPQCNTAFKVTPNQLAVADGVVRCGSCLAVFKAIDHKTSEDKTVSSIAEPEPVTSGAEFDLKITDDALIDDEDTGLSLDDDIYDLDTDNKNKKTSLFDRKLQPISQHNRESADESWALDMLADLEDDDIEPLQISRKPKQNTNDPHKHKDQLQDETSDFITQSDVLDIFDEDSEKPLEPEANIEPVIANPPHQQAEPEIEALYFDHDSDGNIDIDDTHSNNTSHQSNTLSNTHPDPTKTQDYPAEISDQEIEDAMHSRTSYAGDASDYLSSIEPAPVEMEWYEMENTQRWLWLGGATIAGLALIIQIAIFRFESLSKQPEYRSFYATACAILSCDLPDLINTKKIRTTNLVVRSHPSRQQALIVDAILINNANFEQPYPAIRLEFSDINNTLIAARNLQPENYLRGELAGARQMPINQPIQVSLTIVDPGESATNYQLTVIKADVTN